MGTWRQVQAEYHDGHIANDGVPAVGRRYSVASYKANVVMTDLVVIERDAAALVRLS
jgi:hypothetical protein